VITVPVLDTPRLRLRALRAEDAHAIYALGARTSSRVLAKIPRTPVRIRRTDLGIRSGGS
jgi:hypothetical protein